MPERKSLADRLPVPAELIDRRIYIVRGKKVMLDSDLAELYQVKTFNLNKAINRNRDRFPDDFMFQLTKAEYEALIFQIGISKKGRGGRRYLPYAFTELGVAMLSSVLNSDRAVQMNINIMRAFVRLREALATNEALARRIDEVVATQQEHAIALVGVINEIKRLKTPRRRKMKIDRRNLNSLISQFVISKPSHRYAPRLRQIGHRQPIQLSEPGVARKTWATTLAVICSI